MTMPVRTSHGDEAGGSWFECIVANCHDSRAFQGRTVKFILVDQHINDRSACTGNQPLNPIRARPASSTVRHSPLARTGERSSASFPAQPNSASLMRPQETGAAGFGRSAGQSEARHQLGSPASKVFFAARFAPRIPIIIQAELFLPRPGTDLPDQQRAQKDLISIRTRRQCLTNRWQRLAIHFDGLICIRHGPKPIEGGEGARRRLKLGLGK